MADKPKMSLFSRIIEGLEPGNIIARDDTRQIAVIQDAHPEGAIHWLVLPFEHYDSTEALLSQNPDRFLDLWRFAVATVHARSEDYPALAHGFTVKAHFSGFETLSQAKLHILSVE